MFSVIVLHQVFLVNVQQIFIVIISSSELFTTLVFIQVFSLFQKICLIILLLLLEQLWNTPQFSTRAAFGRALTFMIEHMRVLISLVIKEVTCRHSFIGPSREGSVRENVQQYNHSINHLHREYILNVQS